VEPNDPAAVRWSAFGAITAEADGPERKQVWMLLWRVSQEVYWTGFQKLDDRWGQKFALSVVEIAIAVVKSGIDWEAQPQFPDSCSDAARTTILNAAGIDVKGVRVPRAVHVPSY
jgi:hypothetical protein